MLASRTFRLGRSTGERLSENNSASDIRQIPQPAFIHQAVDQQRVCTSFERGAQAIPDKGIDTTAQSQKLEHVPSAIGILYSAIPRERRSFDRRGKTSP